MLLWALVGGFCVPTGVLHREHQAEWVPSLAVETWTGWGTVPLPCECAATEPCALGRPHLPGVNFPQLKKTKEATAGCGPGPAQCLPTSCAEAPSPTEAGGAAGDPFSPIVPTEGLREVLGSAPRFPTAAPPFRPSVPPSLYPCWAVHLWPLSPPVSTANRQM